TVAVYPGYLWLAQKLGGRKSLAAGLLTVLGLVITIGPVAALGAGVVEAGVKLAGTLSQGEFDFPTAPDWLLERGPLAHWIHDSWTEIEADIQAAIAKFGPSLLSAGSLLVGKIAGIGMGLLLMAASVLIMGFLFKPGPEIVAGTRRFANRVFAPRGAGLIDLAGATVRNVSRGIIGVALIQSLMAGVLMVAFGVPLAGPLSLICLILGIIQVGPGLVILPVIIWAFTSMGTPMAIAFTVLMVPVMIIDNILKPIFMAHGLHTPMLVILVGVIGGLFAYGLVGLFVGPVVLSVFYELFMEWLNREDPSEDTQPSELSEPSGPGA
ncbi:MAG: AI-2E family transporter, partial [Mangrovicoccus sp.]